MEQGRHATVKGTPTAKPEACQTAQRPSSYPPPLLATPGGHHLALNPLGRQKEIILLSVVVTERGYT